MADSSLQVKVSADVSELVAQKAVAKVELADLNATVKDLATQFVAASDDMKASLSPQLEQAAQQAENARAHLASLNAEMKEANHPEVVGFFNQLHESVRVTGESIGNLHARLSVFGNLASEFSELVVSGLALEQVGETISKVAETGEQLEKLSQETGLSTEELSGLRVMAEQTGTSFDEFSRLLDTLPGKMQQAATEPAGKAGEAFAAMGVQVADASTGQLRPMGEVLDEVAAKLASYADGANKTALETDIFGSKIGASLIPMLNQLGQVGLQGAIDQSNRLNQTWTKDTAEAAERYEQDMGRAKLAVEGITDSIVRGLLPALDALADKMAPTLNEQIASLQAKIASSQSNRGRAFLPELNQQLAALEAEKKAVDASIAKQTATAGGAAPGSVQAPAISAGAGGDWMKEQETELDKQNAQIEQGATTVKQANAEKLQNTVQYWQGVLATGDLTNAQELQAQDALSKAETALRGNQLSSGASAAKTAEDQKVEIARAGMQSRLEIMNSEYQQQVAQWDAEVTTSKISKEAEIQDEIAAQNQIYQAHLQLAQQLAALETQNVAEHAKALDDIEALTAQHNAEIARMDADLVNQQVEDAKKLAEEHEKAAKEAQDAWQKAFQPIQTAFDQSLNGVLQGTETLQQAEGKAAQSIALAFIDAEAKKVENFIAGEAMVLVHGLATQVGLTSAVEAGTTARLASQTTAETVGRAQSATTGTLQISNDAYQAAAGAYSAVAQIPYVGPVLAPIAAATAYAGVMAFDVLSAEGGMAIGPGVNPLVQLHEKEMVLPAHIAQPLQSMVSGGGTGGDAGDVTNHFHFNGVGGDGGGMSSDDVLSTLNSALRSGSLQKYPAISRMMRRGR